MDLIKYFVDNFDIRNHSIEASIFAESMNCNNLSFIVKPYGWWISFKIYNRYNDLNNLISRKITIQNSDFLGSHKRELEEKLTKLLNNKEFVEQLNEAIQEEKKRTEKVYLQSMKQKEVEFVEGVYDE